MIFVKRIIIYSKFVKVYATCWKSFIERNYKTSWKIFKIHFYAKTDKHILFRNDIFTHFFAPFFRLARGLPDILLERSRIRTMSVGLLTISGSAVSDSFTLKESPQSMWLVFNSLLEFVIPICFNPFWAKSNVMLDISYVLQMGKLMG